MAMIRLLFINTSIAHFRGAFDRVFFSHFCDSLGVWFSTLGIFLWRRLGGCFEVMVCGVVKGILFVVVWKV